MLTKGDGDAFLTTSNFGSFLLASFDVVQHLHKSEHSSQFPYTVPLHSFLGLQAFENVVEAIYKVYLQTGQVMAV